MQEAHEGSQVMQEPEASVFPPEQVAHWFEAVPEQVAQVGSHLMQEPDISE